MIPGEMAASIALGASWNTRLQADHRRAMALQTPSQRAATETILQRALLRGAEAVALTGSTVRGRRTATSDLDLMVVGEQPDLGGLHEDVDVYAAGVKAFWERLLADIRATRPKPRHRGPPVLRQHSRPRPL